MKCNLKTMILALFLSSVSSMSAEFNHPGFRRPAKRIDCAIQPIDRATIHPTGDYATAQTVSENWSGYVSAKNFTGAAPNHTVSQVAGSWVVPTLEATQKNAFCAIWVGIDGYLNGTVEQIGTSHNWISGRQQNYAWFEMYPMGSQEIVGFPLDPGDLISTQVTYQSGSTFQLKIVNNTKHVSYTVPTTYTMSSSALRSSAEWIVEAPYSSGILPLSDFQSAQLSACTATINGVTGAINNTNWQNYEITMVNSKDQVEARPSSLAGTGNAFEVSWLK